MRGSKASPFFTDEDIMKLKAIIILTVLAFIAVVVSGAVAQELKGKHKENSIACVDCHKTETPDSPADVEACVECHGTQEDMAKVTEKLPINPHDSHLGEIDCTECHKTHEPSVIFCNQCHNYKMNLK